MSKTNKCIKSIFMRQRASPEGEIKEQRLVRLGCESNLQCLVNHNCIHACTLNNRKKIF